MKRPTIMLFVIAACLLDGEAGWCADKVPAGFTSLFDGSSLDGWHIMNNGRFSVKEKEKVILINRGGGWLRSEKQYQDFELRMVFRFVNKGANSGVFIRSNDNKGPNRAYQVQTKDGGDSICSIYTRGLTKPKENKDIELLKKAQKPVGEWQEYIITAKGAHLEIRLNGKLINTADGLDEKPGYIGIQGEGGILEFRSVFIKELKDADGKSPI